MRAIATSQRVMLRSPWLAGALGAAAITAFMYVAGAIAGLVLGDASRFLGSIAGAEGAALPRAGGVVLLVMAFVWAFLFRRVRESLPGSSLMRGVLFGLLVWAVSTGVLWPLLQAWRPASVAPGWFGLGLGGTGAMITSALAHIVYGLVLGRTLPVPAGDS